MFQIQPYSSTPVYEQIISQAERLILTGLLPEGAQMPSVRTLSIQLSVNPNTIQKAYSELDSRGLLCAVPGKGCFVAVGARACIAQNSRKHLDTLRSLTEELALAGIPLEELQQTVQQAYKEAKK